LIENDQNVEPNLYVTNDHSPTKRRNRERDFYTSFNIT